MTLTDPMRGDFPVFAAGANPNGPTKGVAGRINGPVSLAGTAVNPGDLIVGDADGVVVVPREDAARIVGAAQAKVDAEAQRMAAIRQGKGLPALGYDQPANTRRAGREGNALIASARPSVQLRAASFTTFAHFARSASMNWRNSSGELPTGSEPSARMRSRMSGVFRILMSSFVQPRDDRLRQLRGGPITPYQPTTSNPGSASATAGTSGSAAMRFGVVTAIPRSLPARTCACARLQAGEVEVVLAAEQSRSAPAPSPCRGCARP